MIRATEASFSISQRIEGVGDERDAKRRAFESRYRDTPRRTILNRPAAQDEIA